MFGQNEIVGMKFFKNAAQETLTITSRFFTLQGEGPFRGHPAYFIRLAKCNLACSFCDTYFDSGQVQTFDEIFADADKVINEFFEKRGMNTPYWALEDRENKRKPRQVVLVITGGEPTLQANLTAFLERAQHVFYHTQIESNGTNPLPLPDSTTFVVSPKCNEKEVVIEVPVVGNIPDTLSSDEFRLRYLIKQKTLYELKKNYVATKYLQPKQAMLDRADCLKFVMSAPENDQFSPYSEVPQWAHEWARETGKPVFVSPMNIYRQEPKKAKELRAQKQTGDITIDERSMYDEVISFWEEGLLDMKANQRNHEYTAEYAMKHGFILNLQLHLYASLP